MAEIRETLVNFTKNASKTTGDLIKTAKLNISLTSEQATIKNLYTEIGKKVHEIYQYGGTLGKFFDEKYLELEAAERKIAEIKEQIAVIKGIRECPKCGKNAERGAEFCPKCGIRLEAAAMAEAPPAEAFIPDAQSPASNSKPPAHGPQRACRVCGASNDADTKFCLFCGRIVD
ncbi:MAG: zinc ribbon domain-containing protein [Defluviitaleaceae bacterium]|nr:zinc ribbon domain-containing protein [Defluviitaleaceae bacterium]